MVKVHVPPAVTGPPTESVPAKVAVTCVLNGNALDGVKVALRVARRWYPAPDLPAC